MRGADAGDAADGGSDSYRRYNDVADDPVAVGRPLEGMPRETVDVCARACPPTTRPLFDAVRARPRAVDAAAIPVEQLRRRRRVRRRMRHSAWLYFQYGRYLLIASSRPGSQPANLQGIWNDSLSPPWGSK